MRWLLAVLLFLPFTAEAAVVASFKSAAVVVNLTDDKCKIAVPPGLEKQLPNHATWDEQGKIYKGCWGEHPGSKDHVIMFFEDNTGGAVHRNQFTWMPKV